MKFLPFVLLAVCISCTSYNTSHWNKKIIKSYIPMNDPFCDCNNDNPIKQSFRTYIDSSKFFIGLATFGPLLRYDFLLLMTILPVIVGLTLLAKNSIKEIDSILFLILGTLLAGPILIVFTNFYEILPYRYIPLIVFFAIGIGMFFSKKSTS